MRENRVVCFTEESSLQNSVYVDKCITKMTESNSIEECKSNITHNVCNEMISDKNVNCDKINNLHVSGTSKISLCSVSSTSSQMYNGKKSEEMSEDNHCQYEAGVFPDCQDLTLTPERPTTLPLNTGKRRLLKVSPEEISSPDSPLSDEDFDKILSTETDSQDDLEHSIIQQLDEDNADKIPELTLEEERADLKNWRTCIVGNEKRKIDMRVIEPYKRVLSHGGYLTTGSYNAIITFSACYLPHKSRVDYNYVMDNLFLYVLSTLNQLVTDDYVLVYLHGGTSKDCIPPFSWLKRCYQMIDRKLKKNLKSLYLVHPTFWLKTLIMMIKPFISSKFSRKMQFIKSLTELHEILPIEEACIPDRVKHYDRIKTSLIEKH